MPKPFQWAPLLVLLAEGPESGDSRRSSSSTSELAALADITRVVWPELFGRTAALQLAVHEVSLTPP